MTTEKIYLYHTNDMHSHLEYWPRIAKELRSKRRIHEKAGDTVFSFDIGDACDRVHPLTEATEGKAITRLLNNAEYDAVTIGNNEGIGSTKAQLNQLYEDADYDVILSNMFDSSTHTYPKWANPIKIMTTKTGYKIGVFACTIPLPVSYGPLGWEIEDPFETTARILNDFSDSVDSWIMLSHLGLNYDRELAEKFPIDVIIGAHTHHILPKGERVEGTLLTGAGRFGEWIGQIELTTYNNALEKVSAKLINVKEEVPAVSEEETLTLKYQQIGHQLLQEQIIASIPDTWQINWQGTSEFVERGLDALSYFAGTQAAILSAGLFLQPLIEGIVTRDDLHQALPHPMRVLKCTLKGKDLIVLIESMESQRDKLRTLPMKGLGFRGEIFGEICYRGISVLDDGKVLWNDSPVESEQLYTFASVDHFLYVPFFPAIAEKGENEVLFPHFLRTIIGEYLKEKYPVR